MKKKEKNEKEKKIRQPAKSGDERQLCGDGDATDGDGDVVVA